MSWDKWTDDCDQKWMDFDSACEKNWDNKICLGAHDEWYAQDLDWETPDTPDESCMEKGDTKWDDDCEEKFKRIEAQCYNQGDYQDTPYMWDDSCEWSDAINWFREARKNSGHFALSKKHLSLMSKGEHQQSSAIGGTATLVGAAAFAAGIAFTLTMKKMCKKSTSEIDDDFRSIL